MMMFLMFLIGSLLTAYVIAASVYAEEKPTGGILLVAGIGLGILIIYSMISIQIMPDTVTKVIRDYHSGAIQCTTHIEEGDTTYTYKYK